MRPAWRCAPGDTKAMGVYAGPVADRRSGRCPDGSISAPRLRGRLRSRGRPSWSGRRRVHDERGRAASADAVSVCAQRGRGRSAVVVAGAGPGLPPHQALRAPRRGDDVALCHRPLRVLELPGRPLCGLWLLRPAVARRVHGQATEPPHVVPRPVGGGQRLDHRGHRGLDQQGGRSGRDGRGRIRGPLRRDRGAGGGDRGRPRRCSPSSCR